MASVGMFDDQSCFKRRWIYDSPCLHCIAHDCTCRVMLLHIPIAMGSAVCLTWATCWVEGCNGLGNVHSKGEMKDIQETEDEDELLQASRLALQRQRRVHRR